LGGLYIWAIKIMIFFKKEKISNFFLGTLRRHRRQPHGICNTIIVIIEGRLLFKTRGEGDPADTHPTGVGVSVAHNLVNSGEFQLFGLLFCRKTQLHNFFGSGNVACGFHLVEVHHNSFVVAELERVALASVSGSDRTTGSREAGGPKNRGQKKETKGIFHQFSRLRRDLKRTNPFWGIQQNQPQPQ